MTTAALCEFARARLDLIWDQWSRRAPRTERPWQVCHGPAWETLDDTRATLVTQSRFVHNFAQAWRLTGDPRWRDLALQAADGLLRFFPGTPAGLPVFTVQRGREVVDGRVFPYGVAFVIFALAQAHRLDPQPRFTECAEACWAALQPLRDGHGGWAWFYSATGEPEPGCRTHNPIMHLLEACLAWLPSATWSARAAAIVALAEERLIVRDGDAAWVPEFCDEAWQPWQGDDHQAGLSAGHQWEWAHLLIQARALGVPGATKETARQLAQSGAGGIRGPDDVISRFTRGGAIVADRHLYWDYCEVARGCLWLAAKGVWPEAYQRVPGLLRGLESRCFDPVNRGYVTVGTVSPATANKGDLWRVDYHQVALFADLLDLAPELPR